MLVAGLNVKIDDSTIIDWEYCYVRSTLVLAMVKTSAW